MTDSESIETFTRHQLDVLLLEYEEEKRTHELYCRTFSFKALQLKGVALLNLKINEKKTGLGGKLLLELGSAIHDKLPSTLLKPGDNVSFQSSQGSSSSNKSSKSESEEKTFAVIYKLNDSRVTIAVKDPLPWFDTSNTFRLIKLPDDITYKRQQHSLLIVFECLYRMKHAILDMAKSNKDIVHRLIRPEESSLSLVHGNVSDETSDDVLSSQYFYNPHLNNSQKLAVSYAVKAQNLALVHGPPGTGKTVTLIEVIQQLLKPKLPFSSPSMIKDKKMKILVCGPSNMSVDNLANKLILCHPSLKFCRLGHPARMMETIYPWTLDFLYKQSNQYEVLSSIRTEISECLSQLSLKKSPGIDKRQVYQELKTLRKELKLRENNALAPFVSSFDIILTTCSGAGSKMIYQNNQLLFDVVIIDEAAQALEAECWIPILKTNKIILAGDHCQLSPTVICKEAHRKGLSVTLFDRLMQRTDKKEHSAPPYSRLLSIQYRMNSIISNWSSTEFYNSKLTPDASVSHHLLCDVPGVLKNEITTSAMVLLDTSSSQLCIESIQTSMEGNESKYNEGEASLVYSYVKLLMIKSNVAEQSIAIISPYSAQVELIRNNLSREFPNIEVDTVDGFQGREKEAVIISLTRSNDHRDIGFLSDVRRMNVAITRARRHVCLVANCETIASHTFYERLVDYCYEYAEVRTIEDELDLSNVFI